MLGVYSKTAPEVHSCESGTPGFSFYFDLIAPLFGHNCQAEGAIHRLCSLMRKMGAKTLIKEELEPNQEICEEFADLETRIGKGLMNETEAIRFTFFAAPRPSQDEWQNELPESSFLGYAVVLSAKLPTEVDVVKEKCPSGKLAYVLEAVTRPPAWAVEDGQDT